MASKNKTEYRIMAYFKTDVYAPRSYKRKIYETKDAALQELEQATAYYHTHPYEMHLDKVVVEKRTCTPWNAI